MSRLFRSLDRRRLAGLVAIGCLAGSAGAADLVAPRFAVDSPRLERQPDRTSVDARFRVQSRLEPASGTGQHGSGFVLLARVTSDPDTACAVAGDAVFKNGFE